jgi:hypothetical protein
MTTSDALAEQRTGLANLCSLGLVLMVWALHRFWSATEDIERARHGLIFLGGLCALWLLGL